MDGGRAHWMTLPFWEVPSILMFGLPSCQLARWSRNVLPSITIINAYSIIYLAIREQEGVDAGRAI